MKKEKLDNQLIEFMAKAKEQSAAEPTPTVEQPEEAPREVVEQK